MRRAMVLLTAALCCASVVIAAPTTMLNDFETREDLDTFACRVRYAMVEPVREPRSHGRAAMRLRFFGHPSLSSAPEVLARYALGGLRYANWAPYRELRVDLYNAGANELTLELVFRSGQDGAQAELARPISLPPGEWTRVAVPVADLAAAGIDVSAVSAFGFRAPLGRQPRPSRVIVDCWRLVGGDRDAIREARRAEDAADQRRRPRR